MKYTFEIVETLSKLVTVDADSEQEAYRIVKKMYREEHIILDDTNYMCTEIERFPIEIALN